MFNLFQQIGPSERSRERFDFVNLISNVNSLVVDGAIDHQNRQARRTDAEMLRRHMPGHGVDVGPNDQQIRTHPLQTVDGRAEVAHGNHKIPGPLKCFVKNRPRERFRIQQENCGATRICHRLIISG